MSFDLRNSLNNIFSSEETILTNPNNIKQNMSLKEELNQDISPSKFKKSYATINQQGMLNRYDIQEPNRADNKFSVDGVYKYKPLTARTNVSVRPSYNDSNQEQKNSAIEQNDLITTFKTVQVHKENQDTNYKTNKMKILDNFSKQQNSLQKSSNILKPTIIRSASQPFVRSIRPKSENQRRTMNAIKTRALQLDRFDRFVDDQARQNTAQILQKLEDPLTTHSDEFAVPREDTLDDFPDEPLESEKVTSSQNVQEEVKSEMSKTYMDSISQQPIKTTNQFESSDNYQSPAAENIEKTKQNSKEKNVISTDRELPSEEVTIKQNKPILVVENNPRKHVSSIDNRSSSYFGKSVNEHPENSPLPQGSPRAIHISEKEREDQFVHGIYNIYSVHPLKQNQSQKSTAGQSKNNTGFNNTEYKFGGQSKSFLSQSKSGRKMQELQSINSDDNLMQARALNSLSSRPTTQRELKSVSSRPWTKEQEDESQIKPIKISVKKDSSHRHTTGEFDRMPSDSTGDLKQNIRIGDLEDGCWLGKKLELREDEEEQYHSSQVATPVMHTLKFPKSGKVEVQSKHKNTEYKDQEAHTNAKPEKGDRVFKQKVELNPEISLDLYKRVSKGKKAGYDFLRKDNLGLKSFSTENIIETRKKDILQKTQDTFNQIENLADKNKQILTKNAYSESKDGKKVNQIQKSVGKQNLQASNSYKLWIDQKTKKVHQTSPLPKTTKDQYEKPFENLLQSHNQDSFISKNLNKFKYKN